MPETNEGGSLIEEFVGLYSPVIERYNQLARAIPRGKFLDVPRLVSPEIHGADRTVSLGRVGNSVIFDSDDGQRIVRTALILEGQTVALAQIQGGVTFTKDLRKVLSPTTATIFVPDTGIDIQKLDSLMKRCREN